MQPFLMQPVFMRSEVESEIKNQTEVEYKTLNKNQDYGRFYKFGSLAEDYGSF